MPRSARNAAMRLWRTPSVLAGASSSFADIYRIIVLLLQIVKSTDHDRPIDLVFIGPRAALQAPYPARSLLPHRRSLTGPGPAAESPGANESTRGRARCRRSCCQGP